MGDNVQSVLEIMIDDDILLVTDGSIVYPLCAYSPAMSRHTKVVEWTGRHCEIGFIAIMISDSTWRPGPAFDLSPPDLRSV